jgi:uncharacterized protein involved in response to NO
MRALFALGFRPLYLAASTFAALSVALWAAQFSGLLPAGSAYASPLWHAHEMVFGFAFAVIVGFLFTAGRNWSRQPTPTGAALAAIVGLWLAARILALTPWPWAAAPFDVAFAIAAAIGLAIPLARARNRRNYFFVALLVAMAALNTAFHLVLAGRIAIDAPRVLTIALDVVLFICTVMAGRVIPMFTNNAIPGAGATRHAWAERTSLGAVLALAVADLFDLAPAMVVAAAGIGAIANGLRLAFWHPWATRRKPILWILHAAYAWIPVHLILRAAAVPGWAAPSLASHALAVGAIGGLTIGMMTRTARGHSGLSLETGFAETSAYSLVMAAAAVRVFLPLIQPAWSVAAIASAGFAWSTAFAIYTIAYWPILSQPRIDGLPG